MSLLAINITYNFEYSEYFKNSKNRYVVTFLNLSGDIILVCPMPMNGKNYATLKDFIDNASLTQQKEFWKYMIKYG